MPTSIQLDPEMEARLDKLAEATGHSKLHNLFQLIEQGMENIEDPYLGVAALEAHHRSGEAAIPLDQVIRNLGLNG